MIKDLSAAVRRGVTAGMLEYQERKQLRAEAVEFRQAAEKALRIQGWLTRREGELLFHLARRIRQGEVIVEIGSFLGRSTAFLASGASEDAIVYAIDPHTGNPNWAEAHGVTAMDTSVPFRANMHRLGLSRKVQPVVAISAAAAAAWAESRPIGILFVDGFHSSDAVYEDGSLWLPRLADDGVAAFDDWQDPEVWRGITRLIAEGHLPQEPAGHVGKIAVFARNPLKIPVQMNNVKAPSTPPLPPSGPG